MFLNNSEVEKKDKFGIQLSDWQKDSWGVPNKVQCPWITVELKTLQLWQSLVNPGNL